MIAKEWSEERIAALATDEVKSLRENAARFGHQKTVDLCAAELAKRTPPKSKKPKTANVHRSGQYVSEFHFVCPSELGVTTNLDGTKWSGTWVVDEDHAIAAEKYGSIVALHASKAESSYLQGVVKGWRKSQREAKYSGDQTVRTALGIDFLFEPSGTPTPWKGDATGEKGYAWSDVPA